MSLSYDSKILRSRLSESGYVYKCKPLQSIIISQNRVQESFSNVQPLCQHYDVVVSDTCLTTPTDEDRQQYQDLVSNIGDSAVNGPYSFKTDRVTIDPCALPTEFIADEERHHSLVDELITTEENYVSNMTAFCDIIVKPLRFRAKSSKGLIIGLYQCNTIFNNIEQILEINKSFLNELLKWRSTEDGIFGDICAKYMYFMECYTKFLQGVDAAQEINAREHKSNHNYRVFLQAASQNTRLGGHTLYSMLAQPGQRITRYTMLLTKILKHTDPADKNHASLIAALKKADEIATLADDSPTKLAKIFFNMHRSIQNCPPTLISQSRTLVSHLDAVELDPTSLRPHRPVTIFLLTDKLMVVRRPAYSVRGLDLCGLGSESPGFESVLLKKLEKNSLKQEKQLKFKDWINLGDVELLQGSQSILSSFAIRVRRKELIRNDPSSQTANQDTPTYFSELPTRMYAVSLSEVNFNTVANSQESIQSKNAFIKHFGRSKASVHRCDAVAATYHREWNGCNVYSNIYSFDQYPLGTHKNDLCIVYVTHLSEKDIRCITDIPGGPQILAMIEPLGNDCYKLWMRSKSFFKHTTDDESNQKPQNFYFRDVLFTNLLHWSMKASNAFKEASETQTALRRRNSKGIAITQNLSSSRFLTAASSYLPMTTTSLSTSRPRPKSSVSNSDIAKSLESRLARRNSYASVNSKTSADSVISLRSNNTDKDESSESSGISAISNTVFEGDYGLDEGIILTANQALADSMRDNSGDQRSPHNSFFSRRQRPKSLPFHLPNVDTHGESFSTSIIENSAPMRSTSRGSLSSSIHSSEPGSLFSTINSRTSTLSTTSSSSIKRHGSIEQKVSQMMLWMQHRQTASAVESRVPTIERTVPEVDRPKLDLSSRWDHLLVAYKELKLTQAELLNKVKEKDAEIDVIQSMFQDAIDENQILYQTFNEELEQLLHITEKNTLATDHRPAHPTPEDQIKRKLKTVVKERNGWQHLASDLEKELFILKSSLQS
ncbi:hypothetical protein BGW37DRAFT_553271 [Umbelopsis sp. PMI_123]|nr:hypothetical protein BGW37DRAFT_553271 [Umbelopsis sp. PMI_123]